MKRRTILAGLGASAIGGSALLGSGAFSRVDAQRETTIEVANDENAYLGMKPLDTPNSNNFVELDDNGHLTVDVGEHSDAADEGGDVTDPALGVNSDSFSFFDGMFEICNQGKEDACISYDLPEAPDSRAYGDDFIAPDPDYDEQVVTWYYISEGGDDPAPEGERIFLQEGEAVPLDLGECKEVGLRTVTKGVDATLDAPLVDGDTVLTADVNGDCFAPPASALTVTSSITDQCPDDEGIDIVGNSTTFDVTATVENTSDIAVNNATVSLSVGGSQPSQSLGTLGPNSSTTATFSDVGPLNLGSYGPTVTADGDVVDATSDTSSLDVVESCPGGGYNYGDGETLVKFDQDCTAGGVGEDEEEKENEDEGGSGGDYVYTYNYIYNYKKGDYNLEYEYDYVWSENAKQDPNPPAPTVDESLPCSADGSGISPNPSPNPNPP